MRLKKSFPVRIQSPSVRKVDFIPGPEVFRLKTDKKGGNGKGRWNGTVLLSLLSFTSFSSPTRIVMQRGGKERTGQMKLERCELISHT